MKILKDEPFISLNGQPFRLYTEGRADDNGNLGPVGLADEVVSVRAGVAAVGTLAFVIHYREE